MNILLISPLPPPYGGIASWTVNCMDYVLKNDIGVRVIHLNSAHKNHRLPGSTVFSRIFSGIIETFYLLIDLKENVEKNSIDIIHLNSSASFALLKDIVILKLAKNKGIPVITHWRFGRIPRIRSKNNIEWKLLKYVVSRCKKSIVIDQQSYYSLTSFGFTNIVKIPNPIGFDTEIKSRMIDLEKLKKKEGRIIFVGYVIRDKGVYELVEACSKINDVRELIIIGPYRAKIIDDLRLIASLREDGRWLKILGELSKQEVLNHMLVSPILALPSYSEGLPNVVIEAMAMGCAVVATNVGAVPELLDCDSNSPCGICIDPKNTDQLIHAIKDLISDKMKSQFLGINGKIRVLDSLTLSKIFNHYKELWMNNS